MIQEVQLTVQDRLHELIKLHAHINDMTPDEAATDLAQKAIAARYKKACNRAPANVYPLHRKHA